MAPREIKDNAYAKFGGKQDVGDVQIANKGYRPLVFSADFAQRQLTFKYD